MSIYLDILIGCWAAFAVYWAYSAFSMKRTIRMQYFGARGMPMSIKKNLSS